MKTKQIISSTNQIIPKFKIGQQLKNLFNDEMTILRVYIKNKIVGYDVKITQNKNKSYEVNREEYFEEDYLIMVLMAIEK